MPMIDLGKEMDGPCCGPTEPPKKGEKYYPTIYIDGVEDVDLPEEGEATIKFKMVRNTKDMKKGTHELVLEIREIGNYESPENPGMHKDKRGDDLDKLAKAILEKRGEDY